MKFRSTAAIATLSFLYLSHAALALPSYIRDADVDKGELEIEYQLVGSEDDNPAKDNKRSHKLEGYYGVTEQFQLGGGFSGSRSQGDDTDLTSVFVEAIYQFVEADEAGYDFAILGEYVHAIGANAPNKLEAKFLYNREWGDDFETRANLIIEREIGENRASTVEFVSRINTTYEVNDFFQPGIEWHAEYGRWGEIPGFNNQKHFIGPVVYGELAEFEDSEIEYQLGAFAGATDASEDYAFRFLIEYEMEF